MTTTLPTSPPDPAVAGPPPPPSPTGRRPRAARALVLAVVLASAALTACQPAPSKAQVLVLGDSLTLEARQATRDVHPGDLDLRWDGSRYGTAPCDGLATARALTWVPDVVVISYSGNRRTSDRSCLGDESGSALIRRYLADVTATIDHFRNGRTKVAIVGAPVRLDERRETDDVFSALRALAAERGVTFVDGGAQISPGRTFRASGTCLPTETTCGTAGPGRNTLRSDDGVHFCPPTSSYWGTCAAYSSGAVRFAAAVRTAARTARVPT